MIMLITLGYSPKNSGPAGKVSNEHPKTWPPWQPCAPAHPSAFIRVHLRFLARRLAPNVRTVARRELPIGCVYGRKRDKRSPKE